MKMNPGRILTCTVVAAVIAVSLPSVSYSQDYVGTPVTVTKDKVKVDGKIFYSHIVMEKQTLYSISKAYGVSIDDLYRYNPSLKENGLKKNAILLIPAVTGGEKKAEETRQDPVSGAGSGKTDSRPADGNASETKPGTEQAKPAADTTARQSASQAVRQDKKNKKKKIHTVKWYEDLDTISEKYGISVESIMRENSLTGRKLTVRQKLVIPAEELPEETIAMTVVPEDEPQFEEKDEETATEADDTPKYLFRKSRTDIALVLPLKADGVSGSRHNMDFYSGVLLAARDMALKGMDVNIDVHDIGSGRIPEREKIMRSDIVIGPVAGNDLSRMLAEAPSDCPVVSPLDPKAETLAEAHRNFIQAPTPHEVLYSHLSEWIRSECSDKDSIIFITEKNTRETGTPSTMKSAMDSAGLSYEKFSYSILEGRDVLEPLSALMTESGVNRFVVASESEAFVNDVVRNLNLLIHNKYHVVLYAPAKIRTYETMEVENLHNTNLHACLGYYIDYDSPQVRDFLLKYRALFNTEPSQYAFQGYDIACYCIEMYYRYGPQWQERLDANDREMLQSTFSFRRTGDGWVNNGVRKIVYGKDWSVVRY